MPGRINEQDIQALRERADLAVIVGAHTALARNGARLKGLCPFHGEKTPSFTVDPARGLFHCFGCGAGGDVYGFLQRAEALSFPEAVERLARIVGYDLHYEELTPGQRKALGRRTRIGEAVAAAAAFYADLLRASDGRAALTYLRDRGVSEAEIGAFGLGWAPDSWDALTRHLLGAGFDVAELLDAGLVSQGRQGPVDRFRGRVMFPIRDATGRDVVAFGGRLVPGVELRTDRDGNAPKYLNSPETELYHKSRILYGLDQARAEVARRQVALVVEGYMDVIALARAGVRYAVATCGTALTAEHFALLERHTPRVVLALDADEAGFAAAEKARELAEQVGVREIAVLQLPTGQDPADVAGRGAQAVEQALSGVVTAVEFQIAHLLRTADVSTPEGQVAAYRRTFPLLGGIGDRFLRYRYVRDVVAPRVRLNADLIERELDAALPAQPGGPVLRQEPAAASPAPGDIGSGAQRDPQMVLERTLLQIALQRPDLLPEVWEQVSEHEFRAPASRRLFARLRSCRPGDLDAVLAGLPDDDARSRVRSLAMDELTVPTRAWAEELLARFRSAAVQRELDDVRAELAQVNASTDPALSRELTRRRVDLELRRRALLGGRTA